MILSYTLFFRAFVSLLSDSDSDDNNDVLVQKVIEESSIQRYYLHLCMKKIFICQNISLLYMILNVETFTVNLSHNFFSLHVGRLHSHCH